MQGVFDLRKDDCMNQFDKQRIANAIWTLLQYRDEIEEMAETIGSEFFFSDFLDCMKGINQCIGVDGNT